MTRFVCQNALRKSNQQIPDLPWARWTKGSDTLMNGRVPRFHRHLCASRNSTTLPNWIVFQSRRPQGLVLHFLQLSERHAIVRGQTVRRL